MMSAFDLHTREGKRQKDKEEKTDEGCDIDLQAHDGGYTAGLAECLSCWEPRFVNL